MRNTFRAHSEFIGNVAVMMSGKSIAAVIALFTMPVVARLFVPSDFGVAAVFASITGIASSIASLRYAAAIVLPESPDDASLIMSFCYRLSLTFCILLALSLGIYEMTNISWTVLEILGQWKWALPFSIFFMSVILTQESWLTRNKTFKTLSASLVGFNVGTSGSRIISGVIAGSSVSGLIGGFFFGVLCRFLVQFRAIHEQLAFAFRQLGWFTAKDIAKRYSDFPKFNAPAGLIFSLGQNLPVLFFGSMFSPAVAGLYAMADRLCQVPVAIVAQSVRRVFLQKAADIENQGRTLRKALLLSIGALAVIGFIPFAILWTYGQPLAAWILGDDWLAAGQFLEIIAPWLFMVWISAPCNAIFIVLRKQRFWLALTVAITVFRLSSFAIAYSVSAGPEWTLQAFVIASIIGNLFTISTTTFLVLKHSSERRPPADNNHPDAPADKSA
jgi:O-antigen/teichoic acid export membrane protein